MKKRKNKATVSDSLKVVKNKINNLQKEATEEQLKDLKYISTFLDKLQQFMIGLKRLMLLIIIGLATFITIDIILDWDESIEGNTHQLYKDKIIQEDKRFDSILHKLMEVYKTEKDSGSSSLIVRYYSRNGEILTYHELWEEKDSLQNELKKTKLKLDLAQEGYFISFTQFEEFKNGDTVIVTKIHAPKLDTALSLLPAFRDNIISIKDGNIQVYDCIVPDSLKTPKPSSSGDDR